MSNNSNLAIGAGVGAIAGGTAGYAVGSKKAAEALKHYAPVKGLTIGSDEFIKAQSEYVENGISQLVAKGKEAGKKAAYKLADGFKRMAEHFPEIEKMTSKTKLKWAAGLAVAGAAIGAGIAAVANKVKADKAEQ